MRPDDIKYITDFCAEYEYPDGACEALLAAYDAVCKNAEAKIIFFAQREGYETLGPDGFDFDKMKSDVDLLEERVGVSKFTLQLLNYILLTPHMKTLYEQRGIDLEIYRDSVLDLKWKLFECIRMHGIFGTFVAQWHKHFFKMAMFALGRLQFHVTDFGRDATVGGITLTPETKVINTHIPACGPLTEELCIDAYSRAEKFFDGLFPKDSPTIIKCDSWLLFPEHKMILPETSGIRRFAEQFSLVHARYAAPMFRPWPIFYDKQNAPAYELPESTSLERIYKERYLKGLPSGSGVGVILFKDGKILNNDKDKMV